MTVTIYCIRHGQGLHNLHADYTLPDPKLTPLGEEQCAVLRNEIQSQSLHFSLITASPLCRTLHSASVIFRPCLGSNSGVNIILAIPDAQETSDDPCDVGTDPDALAEICHHNGWPVDLSIVTEGWNDKRVGGRHSAASSAIEARARSTRLLLLKKAQELSSMDEQDINIAIVSHGGFLHFLTEDWEDAALYPATGWLNCEMRAYTFDDSTLKNATDVRLIETSQSRRRRGIARPILSLDEQRALFNSTMQAWEDQGLQNPLKVGMTMG